VQRTFGGISGKYSEKNNKKSTNLEEGFKFVLFLNLAFTINFPCEKSFGKANFTSLSMNSDINSKIYNILNMWKSTFFYGIE